MRQKNIYGKCNFGRTGHLVKFVSDALFGGSFAYMSHHFVGRSGNFRVCNCKVFVIKLQKRPKWETLKGQDFTSKRSVLKMPGYSSVM